MLWTKLWGNAGRDFDWNSPQKLDRVGNYGRVDRAKYVWSKIRESNFIDQDRKRERERERERDVCREKKGKEEYD